MSNSTSMYEHASRSKLRFASSRGELTTEQLWDVPLRDARSDHPAGAFSLNAIAKALHAQVEAASVENFVDAAPSANARLVLAFDVVKDVIRIKLAEEDAAKKRAANSAEREKLLRVLAEKQEGRLSEMSEAALIKRINALGE